MKSALKRKSVWLVRCCLLTAALILIAAGLLRQEHLAVMQKAVRICLECIGIG